MCSSQNFQTVDSQSRCGKQFGEAQCWASRSFRGVLLGRRQEVCKELIGIWKTWQKSSCQVSVVERLDVIQMCLCLRTDTAGNRKL